MMDANSLEKKIKEKPLTQDLILSFLKEKVIEVGNDYQIASARIIKYEDVDRDKYYIKIGSKYTQDEQEISLIHEISHPVYGAIGLMYNPSKKDIEKLLDQEAKRFYEDNKEFVKDLYAKLIDNKIEPRNL